MPGNLETTKEKLDDGPPDCKSPAGAIKVVPDGIESLQPKSVKKKLKDKAFAAAVSREDIALGMNELGVDPTEHIQGCIDGIRAASERVGV